MVINTRAATAEDYDFLWQLEVASMQAYIERVSGWDESMQRDAVARGLRRGLIRIIRVEGEDVGMYDLAEHETHWHLYQFAILPLWQGHGVGTYVLHQISAQATKTGKSLRLRVFKMNPARRLYERVGFVITGETEIDYQMEWQMIELRAIGCRQR